MRTWLKIGWTEIGLYLAGLDKSPLLGIGTTLAHFQESGKTPVPIGKLNKAVKLGTTYAIHSGLQHPSRDIVGTSCLATVIRLNTWSSEHVQQMLEHLYGSAFREDAYEDNGEGWEWFKSVLNNWLFNRSTLSVSVVMLSPSHERVGILPFCLDNDLIIFQKDLWSTWCKLLRKFLLAYWMADTMVFLSVFYWISLFTDPVCL